MRTVTLMATIFAVVSTAALADPVISSFQGNGEITVTNTTPGLRYSVQWRASLATGEWSHTWQDLREVQASTNEMVFGVPMFFRVLEGADLTPPTNVTGFSASPSDQTVSLSWANPLDGDFAGVVVVRSTAGIPDSPTNGTVVYDGLGTSYSDTTLANGTEYYYRVFAYDGDTNYASGAVASATPLANVTTTTVTESFSDADGLNNLVDTVDSTAIYDSAVDRYLAAVAGPSDVTDVSIGMWDTSWKQPKAIPVSNGRIFGLRNQLRMVNGGSGGTVYSPECKMQFLYGDGSSGFSQTQAPSLGFSWTPFTYTNPYPQRVVTNLVVWLRSTQAPNNNSIHEQNTVVDEMYATNASAFVDILNPSSGGNIIQTFLDITSVREAYDAVSYQLTDGITTNSYASFATWYPVTNALTNPTRIRVLLTPASTNLTEAGTGLISVDFRMKKQ
jgi:hypothetical protein